MARTYDAVGNKGYPWDQFDPTWYVAHNYAAPHEEDRSIIRHVRSFFSRELDPTSPLEGGIDVGSGGNLYPALSMLPFCRSVTLWERGAKNLTWLRGQVRGYSPIWGPYWDELARAAAYRRITEPAETLRGMGRVVAGDIFQLPRQSWDIGTLFFVAESISERMCEFELALERFIGCLRPGSPFAAAFMRQSAGYLVGSTKFPAVAVVESDVKHSLDPLVSSLEIVTIPADDPFRAGYHAMILALGRV
jgi:hypothetical protein